MHTFHYACMNLFSWTMDYIIIIVHGSVCFTVLCCHAACLMLDKSDHIINVSHCYTLIIVINSPEFTINKLLNQVAFQPFPPLKRATRV